MKRHTPSAILAFFLLAAAGAGGALTAGCTAIEPADRDRILGHWEAGPIGLIDPQTILLHVYPASGGRIRCTIDLPERGGRDAPTSYEDYADGTLKLKMTGQAVTFEGALDPGDSTLTGTWSALGNRIALEFRRVDEGFAEKGEYRYETPAPGDDGWVTAPASDHGLDPGALAAFANRIREGKPYRRIDGVVIVRHGKLVFEYYPIDFYGRERPHNTMSVTKSVTSAVAGTVFGLADTAAAPTIHTPVLDLFPHYLRKTNWDERKRDITIRHLLMMSSGLDCDGWDDRSPGHADRMAPSRDWAMFTLNLPQVRDPGSMFFYCDGGVEVVAEAIHRVEGRAIDDLARTRIFQPMGIERVRWSYANAGRPVGCAWLQMRARDMAKFGQLFLNGGTWEGKRLLPEAWVRASTRAQIGSRGVASSYGYFWWILNLEAPEGLPGRDEGTERVAGFAAIGNGGQTIVVLPALDMVIATTSGEYGEDDAVAQILRLVEREILPAIR